MADPKYYKVPEKVEVKKEEPKRAEINMTLNAVVAVLYLLHKVHILTGGHIKRLLKSIETDKDPLDMLKELKDIAGNAE